MILKSVIVRLFCALALGFTLLHADPVEKFIREPIETHYSVEDPEFIQTISYLLHAPLVNGNRVKELINGHQFFPVMLEAISRAQTTITFENFIWRSGQVSDRFIEALSERARAGVKVHCIVDGFGAMKFKKEDRKRLQQSGVQLDIHNPIYFWNFWKWNHRTHRKTLVVDGKVGFIGGICIADEWDGNEENLRRWRDTEFTLEGPVVAQIQGIFMDNWIRGRSEVLHGKEYFPPLEEQGHILAQAFKSGSRDGTENARLLYYYSIAAARKSILLSHSYFVPDNLAIEMLVRAQKRGVKVQVITAGKIDWNIVRRAARSRWDPLLAAGVEIYEYQPVKYHSKVMVVDDVWVTCGSVNFDDRSFRINEEANVNVWDREFARRQVEIFERDKSRAIKVELAAFRKRSWHLKFVENFCGLFRGIL
jgi:cardiolipin synthase A/B